MTYTHSKEECDFFTDTLNNKTLIIRKDKITGEVLFDAECLARAIGFKSLKDMIENSTLLENMFLDGINENNIKIFNNDSNFNDAPF